MEIPKWILRVRNIPLGYMEEIDNIILSFSADYDNKNKKRATWQRDPRRTLIYSSKDESDSFSFPKQFHEAEYEYIADKESRKDMENTMDQIFEKIHKETKFICTFVIYEKIGKYVQY